MVTVGTTVVVTVGTTIWTTIRAKLGMMTRMSRMMMRMTLVSESLGAYGAALHRSAVRLAVTHVALLVAAPLRRLRMFVTYAAIGLTVHRGITAIFLDIYINLNLHGGITLLRLSLLCLRLAQRHHRQRNEQKHHLFHNCKILGLYCLY